VGDSGALATEWRSDGSVIISAKAREAKMSK
jgi:hypothetical protein